MTYPSLDRDWLMTIGGTLTTAAGGATYPTTSPSSGEHLADVPAADARDVDRAVLAGEKAQREWAAQPPRQRAAVVRSLAAVLRENRAELGFLDALDGGNPVTAMESDVDKGAAMLDHFADWVDQLAGETHLSNRDNLHYTVRQPFGVVARIVPFNHPIMFAASKIAAPLVAGNAVVLKAPDQTPLSTLRMGELFADLLPAGLLNILTGHGREIGPALVGHPVVRRIAFTGSLATGQNVLQTAAAAGIKTVSLELGGKNPMVVLADADVEAAAQGAVAGMNFAWTAGQSCGSTSRLLVHDSIADEVIERVLAGMSELRLGNPLERSTEVGSLVSAEHAARVNGYIEAGRAEGLTLVQPGVSPDPQGAYVAPAAFLDVPESSVLAREEIFGPVLAISRFSDEAQAFDAVSASEYGLTASVWTRDVAKAHRISNDLHTGYVWVNTSSKHYVGLPFGGVRNSGLGREESIEELHSFTETKSVTVHLR